MWCDALPVKVLKFGGTSVGAVARLRRVVDIVRDAAGAHRVVVVASAASGVTDRLLAGLDRLAGDPAEAGTLLEDLRTRQLALADGLLGPVERRDYARRVEEQLAALAVLLEACAAAPAARLRDAVVAAGERLSVPLVAAALREAGLAAFPQDAAALIRTDDGFGSAEVDLDATAAQVRQWWGRTSADAVPVVTGFIGATADGETTTLGRSGSDYSAALLAASLGAVAFERWTDVDGLYTDDPRHNAQATRLAYIVLEEAVSWNHAGRLGMHRKALDPLVAAGIPVYVRSTAAPQAPGTVILPAGHRLAEAAVG